MTRETRTPRERAIDALGVEVRKFERATDNLAKYAGAVEAEAAARTRLEFLVGDPLLMPDDRTPILALLGEDNPDVELPLDVVEPGPDELPPPTEGDPLPQLTDPENDDVTKVTK